MVTEQLAIGLPVFNGERFLDEVLESIRGQTYGAFELIICDNASTDRTLAICRKHAERDPRIVVHQNEVNIGAASNFNRVYELAQPCKYFKWAAADDLLAPSYLEECMQLLEADDGVVLAHSEVAVIDEDGNAREAPHGILEATHCADPVFRFRAAACMRHWCFDVFGVMRNAALQRTKLIAPYIASDRNLLADMSLLGRYAHVAAPLFLSRDHGGRSIRGISLRDRGAWFDPRLRGRLVLPHFRQFWEYVRSVLRLPLGLGTRIRCVPALLSWLRRFRYLMWRDLRHASAVLVNRVRPTILR